jgi:hypothetical protein
VTNRFRRSIKIWSIATIKCSLRKEKSRAADCLGLATDFLPPMEDWNGTRDPRANYGFC